MEPDYNRVRMFFVILRKELNSIIHGYLQSNPNPSRLMKLYSYIIISFFFFFCVCFDGLVFT